MKTILNHLFEHKTFDKQEAKDILIHIAQGKYNEYQIASFLTVFMMRSITLQELEGFRDALLELCISIDLSAYDTIDLCGTGGDGKNTFNVSTLSSFIVAGAGIHVTKHGNYGVSSTCGSSNVLEALGIDFTCDASTIKRNIEKYKICFLHAPLFHPALKNVGPIRRALGVKTFFNMLGPMVNPTRPTSQMVGVFNLELARKYAYIYQQTEQKFTIVHSLDGYDEISLTAPFKIMTHTGEEILSPSDLGMPVVCPQDILGGDTVEEAKNIFLRVLSGGGTLAQRNVVIANAAMAIYTTDRKAGLESALQRATDTLDSKKALHILESIQKNTL